MKKIIIILTLVLLFLNSVVFAASKTTKKEIQTVTKDGFTIKSVLEYPKVKNKQEYNTVVLLHSLGYSSQWWENLPSDLLNNGYAVLTIDLRGHGNSVYNSKLVRTSWKNLTNSAFGKYPDDVVSVLEQIKTENKITFLENWVILGSDIGANTAVLVADRVSYKPKTIIMLSPHANARGLFIPIKIAEMNNIDILSISGTDDVASINAQEYLKRFSQATFSTYISESKSSGMLMLKNDRTLAKVIVAWIKQYI